jgi:hypothetical protein
LVLLLLIVAVLAGALAFVLQHRAGHTVPRVEVLW